jgi:hypothetical protein
MLRADAETITDALGRALWAHRVPFQGKSPRVRAMKPGEGFSDV